MAPDVGKADLLLPDAGKHRQADNEHDYLLELWAGRVGISGIDGYRIDITKAVCAGV